MKLSNLNILIITLFTLSSVTLQAQKCCGAPGRSGALQRYIKEQNCAKKVEVEKKAKSEQEKQKPVEKKVDEVKK